MIFDDAFGKWRERHNGPVQTKEVGRQWDAQMVAEEQAIIQRTYNSMPNELLRRVEAVAKGEKVLAQFGKFIGMQGSGVPQLPNSASLSDYKARFELGISAMGYDVMPVPEILAQYKSHLKGKLP